jgi:transforming growth factor-beta-induced protein
METMTATRRTILAGLACLALVGFGCAEESAPFESSSSALRSSNGTLLDVIKADPHYSTLVAALEFAELDGAIDDPAGDLTLFAPSNAAFDVALRALGLTAAELLSEANRELVTDILLYHVVAGTAPSSAVLGLDSGAVTTLQGDAVSINIVLRRFIQLNGEGFVIDADNNASNGVVHGVNRVLLPPSIFGDASSIMARLEKAPEFSTLVAAIKFAGLQDALAARDAELTLLAPDNRAFNRLLSRLGLTAAELLTDANKDLVTQILLYHVIDGEARSADIRALSGKSVATLQGESISVRALFIFLQLNRSVNVTRTDIDASNGVIHALDGVLLPPSLGL